MMGAVFCPSCGASGAIRGIGFFVITIRVLVLARITRDSLRGEHRFKIYHDGRFYDVPADRLEAHDIVLGQGDAEEARERLQKVLDMMPEFIDDYVPER